MRSRRVDRKVRRRGRSFARLTAISTNSPGVAATSSGLPEQKSQQMQRLRVVRVRRQHLAKKRFRLAEFSALLMLQPQFQQRLGSKLEHENISCGWPSDQAASRKEPSDITYVTFAKAVRQEIHVISGWPTFPACATHPHVQVTPPALADTPARHPPGDPRGDAARPAHTTDPSRRHW